MTEQISHAKKFGIEHYSPSTLNLFSCSIGNFIMEKVIGVKLPVGAAAYRGRAVEDGLTMLLNGSNMAEAWRVAIEKYNVYTALCTDPNLDKERDGIIPIIKSAWAEIQPWGQPDIVQKQVTLKVPELPLPFMGFLDYAWTKHRRVIDLKAQLRLTHEVKVTHARQVAFYTKAMQAEYGGEWQGGVLYAAASTAKKENNSHTLKVDNIDRHFTALVQIAKAMEKFLSLSNNPEDFVSITAPDFDSFYWNDPAARRAAHSIWGY
jgi:hypothetical protein